MLPLQYNQSICHITLKFSAVITRLFATQKQRGLCSQSGILLETLNTQKLSSKLGRSEKTLVGLAAVWKTRLEVEMRMKCWCLHQNFKWRAVVSLSMGRHPGSIKLRWKSSWDIWTQGGWRATYMTFSL